MERDSFIFGRRAVIEALESGRTIDKVLLRRDLEGELAAELLQKIRELGVPVQRVPVERLNRITMKNHQGAIALLAAVDYSRLDYIVPELYEEGKSPLMLALDGVTDTRNFGAIVRTAECGGVDAVVIPERGSASATPDAMKTSAGALLYVPVCRERSLAQGLRFLKENGYQVVAASEKGNVDYCDVDFTVPTVIVMGAEETGISDEILRMADRLASIPILGKIGSLNVSVAAGVLVYEAVRQRNRAVGG